MDVPDAVAQLQAQRSALELQIKDEERRLARLEDLLLDGTFDQSAFVRKQGIIQLRLADLRDELLKLPDPAALTTQQEHLAELRKSLVLLYDMANRAEKRMIVENVWPNRKVSGNQPAFEPYSWVVRTQTDMALLGGAHERDRDRTYMALLDLLRTLQQYRDVA